MFDIKMWLSYFALSNEPCPQLTSELLSEPKGRVTLSWCYSGCNCSPSFLHQSLFSVSYSLSFSGSFLSFQHIYPLQSAPTSTPDHLAFYWWRRTSLLMPFLQFLRTDQMPFLASDDGFQGPPSHNYSYFYLAKAPPYTVTATVTVDQSLLKISSQFSGSSFKCLLPLTQMEKWLLL